VEVLNRHDVEELVASGLPRAKILMVHNGLEPERLKSLSERTHLRASKDLTVVFIGTFDYRKGAKEFPLLWSRINESLPDAKLRLLGTGGLMPDEASVRARFPRRLQRSLEIIPSFDPADLCGLLPPSSIGVFPSHIEGFGLGVLEMLASSIPVIAYDAPGPPEMLAKEWLVPRGDIDAMARRVVNLWRNPRHLAEARERARVVAETFTWERSARLVDSTYRERVMMRRRGARSARDLRQEAS
jgi:glycosyltransferase involved in cell wall biosynthesis